MKQVLLATLASVILAEWLEFWYRFGATHDPQAFVGASAPYVMMALVFHTLVQLAPRLPRSLWLILGCLPGMGLEWFVIGNSPWGNPEASQVGMFVFHATWPIWGRVFDRTWFSASEARQALIWMGFWSVALLPLFLIPDPFWRFAGFIWLPLLPYLGLFVLAIRRSAPVSATA